MASSPIPLPAKNPTCCFCERVIPTCDIDSKKRNKVLKVDRVLCRLCQWDAQTDTVKRRWRLEKAGAFTLDKDTEGKIILRKFDNNPWNYLRDEWTHDSYGLVLAAQFDWK
jgi:hypothetical protein